MIKPMHLYMAGGAVALLGLVWLLQKGNAKNLGSAAGGAAMGLANGLVTSVGDALGVPRPADVAAAGGRVVDTVVAAANNPELNPLQPFGAWLGSTLYDVIHPVR